MTSSPNTRELLARIVLAGDTEAQAACLAFSRSNQWKEAVHLAVLWKILPSLSRRIAALGYEVELPARSMLRRKTTGAFMQSARAAQRGVNALAALRRNKIPTAAFKGLAAIAGLYRNPGDRFIRDTDVLVRREDLGAVLACLEGLGFKPELAGDLSNYTTFMSHSPAFAGNFSVAVRDADDCEIDLHWRIGISGKAAEIDQLLERAVEVELFGSVVPVVAPTDSLILTSHHAFREILAPEMTFRDVLDIEAWCGQLAACGELPSSLEYVASLGLAAPLLAIINIPLAFNSQSPLRAAAGRLRGFAAETEIIAAAHLTNLFVLQIRQASLNKDLSYLFHPRSVRQIATGLFSGWSGHRHFMQDMEVKNLGHELPLSGRVRSFLGAFARLTPAQLRAFRALGKVKEAYQNSQTR